jgi:hypothetical protein
MVFCRMPETPRPSLLDELRQRSEALRAERAVARLPEERSRHEIDGALWRAYRWLDEAMGHLEVIRPEVLHKHLHSDTAFDKDKVVRNTLFHVEPMNRASVRFKPDYRRHAIDVMLRNVDRFESVLLEFGHSGIDEAALEDLVRLVLGESNAFLHRAPLAYVNSRRA